MDVKAQLRFLSRLCGASRRAGEQCAPSSLPFFCIGTALTSDPHRRTHKQHDVHVVVFESFQSHCHPQCVVSQVLSTIHQPRSSIFAMFDLLLLVAEGKLLYYGPAALAVRTQLQTLNRICLCWS